MTRSASSNTAATTGSARREHAAHVDVLAALAREEERDLARWRAAAAEDALAAAPSRPPACRARARVSAFCSRSTSSSRVAEVDDQPLRRGQVGRIGRATGRPHRPHARTSARQRPRSSVALAPRPGAQRRRAAGDLRRASTAASGTERGGRWAPRPCDAHAPATFARQQRPGRAPRARGGSWCRRSRRR